MQVYNPLKGLILKVSDEDILIPQGPKWFNPEQAAKLRANGVFKSAVLSGRLIADGEFIEKKPKKEKIKSEGKRKSKKD